MTTPTFSTELKDALRQRSHAILEDNLTYEDEGGEPDLWSGNNMVAMCLDAIGPEPVAEWRRLEAIHGHDAMMEEACKHITEA